MQDLTDSGNKSQYFRIPRCSSSFFALATLEPPSPTSSPVSSVSSVAFEDLPIFFVDSVRPESFHPDSQCWTPLSGEYVDLPPATSLSSIGSLASVVSFGTFGPKASATAPGEDIYQGDDLCPNFQTATYHDLSVGRSTPSPRLEAIPEEASTCTSPVLPQEGFGRVKRSARRGQIGDDRVEERNANHDRSVASMNTTHQEREGLVVSSHGQGAGRGSRPKVKGNRSQNPKPVEFVWLHGVSIDLLIDQEGFRSATPSFRYHGAHHTDGHDCKVIFRPSPKQSFYFHYNPFDSLPILRRVTVHGEETRDYISKQAQLTLKSNGVYSVHGAEVSSLSNLDTWQVFSQLGHDRNSRLEWEFQYLVADRADTYGNIVDGEKKFVPLAFTCSPWLLHPSQGKRINLVHIFKKGVASKLTAEKFSPNSTGGQSTTTTAGESRTLVPVDHLRSHRRVQSHAAPEVGTYTAFTSRGENGMNTAGRDRGKHSRGDHTGGTKLRRRASSVGVKQIA
ncbi:hypothetical protein CC1G_01872 [Coprinopsis cinerea okayama7|uniref:Uncharacterized protein n=1 Tax=Coprinopsis cinerea (strain Okayama-7 / 130 / ATCC MYA-4618 / FGSC 9003) TaxID=240176 RepID=A8N2Q8_COPC7|nr:hypothetical protein CC1G_01872 [Coprinopsis cinerea okayama7\|eukprot:XP_001829192.1 hypothetical protein CC1G_01872 [Coprinopsis cinerea okayama7\